MAIDEVANALAAGIRQLRKFGFNVVEADSLALDTAQQYAQARLAACSLLGLDATENDSCPVGVVARALLQNCGSDEKYELKHTLIVGSARQGKGVAPVFPSLMSVELDGSGKAKLAAPQQQWRGDEQIQTALFAGVEMMATPVISTCIVWGT